MRRLFLLRHAKTEVHALNARDRDRRLEGRGPKDAALMGRWLAAHPPLPDHVYVSPATRTRETWDIVTTQLNNAVPHTYVEDVYAADASDLLKIVRMAAIDAPHALMLIGHNPALHELVLGLLAAPPKNPSLIDNLPTSGIAVIDLPIDDWTDISLRSGTLIDFVTPKILKANDC